MWIFPVLATLAFTGYLVTDVALHLLPTGLSPVQHALSHYATSPYRQAARTASLFNIVGICLLCVALAGLVGVPPLSWWAIGILALVGMARFCARIFPLDAPDAPATWRGRVHLCLAVIAFGASVLALERITQDLGQLLPWQSLVPALTALAQVSLWLSAILALTYFVSPLRRVFGLSERIFMLVITGWLLIVSGYLGFLSLGFS